MPIDKENFLTNKFFMVGPSTDREIEIKWLDSISINEESIPVYESMTLPQELTISIDGVIPEEFKSLFKAKYKRVVIKQAKIHKKKRINKKWKKRYGYTCTLYYV